MVEGDPGSPTWKFTQYVLSRLLFTTRDCNVLGLLAADPKKRHRIIKAVRLTRINRCFGDKGDVEDITEGKDEIPSIAG